MRHPCVAGYRSNSDAFDALVIKQYQALTQQCRAQITVLLSSSTFIWVFQIDTVYFGSYIDGVHFRLPGHISQPESPIYL